MGINVGSLNARNYFCNDVGRAEAGRAGIFKYYRLCVAAVIPDYGLTERREQAPVDSRERRLGSGSQRKRARRSSAFGG
jgi:hypothetical protein